MLVLAALLGLAALGQTLVLILGGLDLSVPGHIVMGAIVVSELYGKHGWSAPPAIARRGHRRGVARREPPAGSATAGASSR